MREDTQTYVAKRPCSHCGTTRRYRSTRHCVRCQIETVARGTVERRAVWRNTFLALYHADAFDRMGEPLRGSLRNTYE